MPNPSRFSFGEKRTANYKRLVRNVKAKINRVQKKYGVDLSHTVDIPAMRDINTYQEYKSFVDQAKNFTSRSNLDFQFVKNKYDVVANKKTIQQAKRKTKENQQKAREYQKEIQDKPFFKGNQQVSTVGGRMEMMARPDIGGLNVPPDFKFEDIASRQQLARKIMSIQNRQDPDFYDKRNQIMKQNFITRLEENTNKKTSDIIRKLKKMNPDDFFELYMQFAEFDFNDWDSEGNFLGGEDKAENALNEMESQLDRYLRGDVDVDLSKF